jgi:hypothetical protein
MQILFQYAWIQKDFYLSLKFKFNCFVSIIQYHKHLNKTQISIMSIII